MCMALYSVGAKDRIKMHADTGTSKNAPRDADDVPQHASGYVSVSERLSCMLRLQSHVGGCAGLERLQYLLFVGRRSSWT